MNELSIILPTRNRPAALTKALSSIAPQCAALDNAPHVVVVDDCSSTKNSEKNEHACRKNGARYHRLPSRSGPAAARNRGLELTDGAWAVFCDDDIEADDNWLANLTNAIHYADEETVGIEGCVTPRGSGVWDNEVQNLSGGLYLTANIAYRRQVLDEVGAFDESFPSPAAEDQELALRMLRKGKVTFCGNANVFHASRRIGLLSYVAKSPSRMATLLKTEYYFFRKHPDRYHTHRFAPTFWGTFRDIITKHLIITLKRRKIGSLIRHPLQAITLVSATAIEQMTSWLCIPLYMLRFRSESPLPHITGVIDLETTTDLWNARTTFSPQHLYLPANPVASALFRLSKKPVYDIRKRLKKLSALSSLDQAKVFLRIDDVFMSDHNSVNRLIDILSRADIPFLAAVTGGDLTNAENHSTLKELATKKTTIALHGREHQGSYGPFPSEILQLSGKELEALGEPATSSKLPAAIRPTAFVPPFNAISWNQIIVLGTYFDIICGGPESARFTGRLLGPIKIRNGPVYFPSFYPFYQSAQAMAASDIVSCVVRLRVPVCITVHCPEEARNDFAALSKLLRELSPHLCMWSELTERANKQ